MISFFIYDLFISIVPAVIFWITRNDIGVYISLFTSGVCSKYLFGAPSKEVYIFFVYIRHDGLVIINFKRWK